MEDILAKTPAKSANEKEEVKLPISWAALEHDYAPKGEKWLWSVTAGTALIIVAAILMHNFLLGVFSVIAGFFFALYGIKKPETINFSIDIRGIKIGNKLLPYDSINSFWINYDPPHKKEIIIETKKMFSIRTIIPLGNTDPNAAKAAMIKFLKEKKIEESLIDSLIDWIGF